MEKSFSDDYRVYMRLALLEMLMQEEKRQSERNYTQTNAYYKKAEELYQKTKKNGETDENMQLLEMKIQELYDKDWLH